MIDKQETHAAVIAEMRAHDPRVSPRLTWDNSQACERDDYFAARLEAAHKRELSASGNAAKLREALAPFPSLCEWMVENAAKLGIPDMVAKLRERGDKARAALATTAEEGGAE